MTEDNAGDLPALLQLLDAERIDKFYFSHLNYAGRGNKNRAEDARHRTTRWAMDLLFEVAWDYARRGVAKELVTGNNDADGVYLLHWARERFPALRRTSRRSSWPGAATPRRERREHRQRGQRPPRHHVVAPQPRQRAPAVLLGDLAGPVRSAHGRPEAASPAGDRALRRLPSPRDLQRQHARARPAGHWDAWAEDPGCYLTDAEIGVSGQGPRLAAAPWVRSAAVGPRDDQDGRRRRSAAASARVPRCRRRPGCPLPAALRELPRAGPLRRHGAGPAAREPRAAEEGRRGEGDRVGTAGDTDAGLCGQAAGRGDRGAGAMDLRAGVAAAGLGRGADPRSRVVHRAPGRCPTGAVRRGPHEPVHRGGAGRPPGVDPGRRPAGADPPFPVALRVARRAKFTPDGRYVSSGRATAGSPSSTSGTSKPSPRSAPPSTPATSRCRRTGAT